MWSAAAEVKIGLMHALTGSMQSRETPLYLAELIAIEEINARGGLLGRMVEPSAGSQGLPACTLRPERGSTRSSCFRVAGVCKFRWSRIILKVRGRTFRLRPELRVGPCRGILLTQEAQTTTP